MENQLVRRLVQRLTMVSGCGSFIFDKVFLKSFLTLSLDDAAQRVDLSSSAEIEKMLRDMV